MIIPGRKVDSPRTINISDLTLTTSSENQSNLELELDPSIPTIVLCNPNACTYEYLNV
jgi:hypothetical protein